MTERQVVGVIGATGMVGDYLLPLLALANFKVVAFSRQPVKQSSDYVNWRLAPFLKSTDNNLETASVQPNNHPADSNELTQQIIPYWICLAPIWVLPEYFQLLKTSGTRRIVALSSTSRFTKNLSSDDSERQLVQHLIEAEAQLTSWAEKQLIEWVILRPTLIYGLGKDKNINEIVRLIRRFGFFPLIGKANGLRQPIHTNDVALVVLSALSSAHATNKSYNLSGGETLTYKQMVERIFLVLNRKPLFLKLPKNLMQLLILIMHCLPRYRSWKLSMVERMNQDLVFDHHDATQDLNFSPRTFKLEPEDLA